jgi:hypothetical protein
MRAKPVFPRRHVGTTLVAATLAAVIAIGLLGGIAGLFQRDGVPLEQLVVAEHACADHAFVSEREICMRLFLAGSRLRAVASR